MSWDGFLPEGTKCEQCGTVLKKDAESYAGTFTGLCRACENISVRIEKVFFDRAVKISYPPHCPSWRRNRDSFIAYKDCKECGGSGKKTIIRSMAYGGSYPVSCPLCSDRFYKHPLRVWKSKRFDRIQEKGQSAYVSLLKNNRIYGKTKKGEAPEEKIEELKRFIRTKMERLDKHLKELYIKKEVILKNEYDNRRKA